MSEPGSASGIPLVSVLMPFFNASAFIAQAIDSVWRQTHANIELIAVDDGSTDSSHQMVADLQRRAPIPMQLHRQANAGPSAALHNALGHANGEWICWLAADDWYAPRFIERNLEVAAALPAGDWVLHCNGHLVEPDGRVSGTFDAVSSQEPLRGDAFELRLSGRGRMAPSTMFVRRELLIKAGGFDPTFYAEDHDLFLRLARNAEFHYIEEPLFFSRHTPGSLGKKPWLWADDVIRAIAKHQDLLRDRMPALIAEACENIAVACFANGGTSEGLRWAKKAIDHARGTGGKAKTAARLLRRAGPAVAHFLAQRLVGRERLVRAKRALLRQNRAARDG